MDGECRGFALLQPIEAAASQERLRESILRLTKEHEAAIAAIA